MIKFFLPCWFLLLLSLTASYDPRPSLIESVEFPKVEMPSIKESDIEEAFNEAERNLAQRLELEIKLVEEGRIVNRNVRSAKSVHQLAALWAPQVSRMEERQRKFEEVTHILARKYNLTSAQIQFGLRRLPLPGRAAESARQFCTSQETMECNGNSPYRTADGSCNNVKNPTWGMASSCNNRLPVHADYSENSGLRLAADGGPLPEPRVLSLNIHSHSNYPTKNVTHMLTFFGQLLDHDITLTPQSRTVENEAIECCPSSNDNHPQCAPIGIKKDDPFYSQFNVTCLNFVRSAICPTCTTGERMQMNRVTAFIDCSFVYGNSENQTSGLRNNDGSGTLRTQEGDLLPPSEDPNNDQCSRPSENLSCFVAGDARVNQHTTLAALQTVFVREHNRIARNLSEANPTWGEERLFQQTKKIVSAMMQNIVYREYLPIILGPEKMLYFKLRTTNGYTTYNPKISCAMIIEFVTAAFRFGHSMINNVVIRNPTLRLLRDDFSAPFGLYNGEANTVLREATRNPSQQFDRWMVPDVTNFLYRAQGENFGLDLASFNIQRGRDHGVAGYTAYVHYCSKGKINITGFSDLRECNLMTDANVRLLRRNYRHVQDIDLFTGMTNEKIEEGAVIGPTAICIIGLQFYRLKHGDRFHYEHCNQSGSFTSGQLAELRKASLAKIICQNTDIGSLQPNVMLHINESNPPTLCEDLPEVNLTFWKENNRQKEAD